MRVRIILYVMLLLILTGCNTIRVIKLKRNGHQAKKGESMVSLYLEKAGVGKVSEFSKEFTKEDTVVWKYRNGIVYFKTISSYIEGEEATDSSILPVYGLYGGGHILIKQDNESFLLYDMRIADFKLWLWEGFIPDLQKTGYEDKLIKRDFGDSLKIQKKLSKAKSLDEIFKK